MTKITIVHDFNDESEFPKGDGRFNYVKFDETEESILSDSECGALFKPNGSGGVEFVSHYFIHKDGTAIDPKVKSLLEKPDCPLHFITYAPNESGKAAHVLTTPFALSTLLNILYLRNVDNYKSLFNQTQQIVQQQTPLIPFPQNTSISIIGTDLSIDDRKIENGYLQKILKKFQDKGVLKENTQYAVINAKQNNVSAAIKLANTVNLTKYKDLKRKIVYVYVCTDCNPFFKEELTVNRITMSQV